MGNIQFRNEKILFVGTKVAMDPACCCPEIGDDCEFCDNDPSITTAKKYTILASGITTCECVEDTTFFDFWELDTAIDINTDGPFVLTQTGADPCIWAFTIGEVDGDTIATLVQYENSDCSTIGTSTVELTFLRFTLTRKATEWDLDVAFSNGIDRITMFSGTVADAEGNDCREPSTPISNTGSCNLNFDIEAVGQFATGGSFTITAGP